MKGVFMNKKSILTLRAMYAVARSTITPLFSVCILSLNTVSSSASFITPSSEEKGTLQKQLFVQIKEGNVDNVKGILDKGVSLHHTNSSGLTPLHCAVLSNHLKVAYLLIQAKALVNAYTTQDRTTPLHDAVDKGNLVIVKLLLSYDADVTLQDNEGHTPLYKAQQKSKACLHPEEQKNTSAIIKLLSIMGAEKDQSKAPKSKKEKQRKYNKLLLKVTKNGNRKKVERLLQAGAHIDVVDKDGNTPLHLAAAYGHKKIADLLVNRGANIEAINKSGRTPMHMALYNEHTEVASLFNNIRGF